MSLGQWQRLSLYLQSKSQVQEYGDICKVSPEDDTLDDTITASTYHFSKTLKSLQPKTVERSPKSLQHQQPLKKERKHGPHSQWDSFPLLFIDLLPFILIPHSHSLTCVRNDSNVFDVCICSCKLCVSFISILYLWKSNWATDMIQGFTFSTSREVWKLHLCYYVYLQSIAFSCCNALHAVFGLFIPHDGNSENHHHTAE